MSEWREVNLDEIVKFQRGHDLTVANIKDGNYPVAGSNGVIGYHNQFTTKAPGITQEEVVIVLVSHIITIEIFGLTTQLYIQLNLLAHGRSMFITF